MSAKVVTENKVKPKKGPKKPSNASRFARKPYRPPISAQAAYHFSVEKQYDKFETKLNGLRRAIDERKFDYNEPSLLPPPSSSPLPPPPPSSSPSKHTSSGTLLHYVIRGGDPECVLALLQRGASVLEFCEFSIDGKSIPKRMKQLKDDNNTNNNTNNTNNNNIVRYNAYDYANLLNNTAVVTTLRSFLGKKHWNLLRQLWLGFSDKKSVISGIPAEVVAIIHEKLMMEGEGVTEKKGKDEYELDYSDSE